jgi:predicted phosphatase
MYRQTVIFDFDGVIHSYTSGWKGADVILDAPVVGIKKAIEEIRKEFKVIVVSTRCYQDRGINAIKEWLRKWQIEVDDVTSEKPPAIVTIDDRAICFDGNSRELLDKIKYFNVWNK